MHELARKLGHLGKDFSDTQLLQNFRIDQFNLKKTRKDTSEAVKL